MTHDSSFRESFRRFVVAYLIAAPVVAFFLIPFVPHPVIGGILLLHGLLLAPTFVPNGAWFSPVVRRFATLEKEVILTLDDGPDPELTPQVLELLKAYDAKACFFVVGRKVREYPELVCQIAAGGHELANHTYSHRERWFWAELWSGAGREIDACSNEITKATGKRTRWFRPPVGMSNPFLYPEVHRRQMQTLGWSTRAKDAIDGIDTAACAARVIDEVKPGCVILMHPEWRGPSNTHQGLACLEMVMQGLKNLGYRCVLPPH